MFSFNNCSNSAIDITLEPFFPYHRLSKELMLHTLKSVAFRNWLSTDWNLLSTDWNLLSTDWNLLSTHWNSLSNLLEFAEHPLKFSKHSEPLTTITQFSAVENKMPFCNFLSFVELLTLCLCSFSATNQSSSMDC